MIKIRLVSVLFFHGIASVGATACVTRHIQTRALQQAHRLRGGADEIGCIFDDRTERTQEECALLKDQQQSAMIHSAEIFGSLVCVHARFSGSAVVPKKTCCLSTVAALAYEV
jgi:hypothetical protein